jgi:predicted dehydrogenase
LSRSGSGPTLADVNVGILGCGHVSDQYLTGCAGLESLEVVACADLDLNRAEQKAAEHSVGRACTPERLLADPEVELVVNLTPPRSHAEVSLAAIRAGKHVWSEKPLGVTLEEAAELIEAAAGAGVRLGCAPDTFLGAGLQTSIKLIEDGWIGEPVAAVACVSEHGYEHFHPDVSSFYARGGGPVLDLGPYYVTALVAMLGPVARVTGLARESLPGRTFQLGPRAHQPIDVQVPTHVTGALELESGPLVTVLFSWDLWATNLPYLEIYGTEGTLVAPNPDQFDGTPRLRRAGPDELRQPPPEPASLPFTPIPHAFETGGARGLGVADIAAAVETGRPHRASPELAYHVLEVLLALQAGGTTEIESRVATNPPG